ncbi:MAG: hypothetical protein ABIO70_01980 [Pseudomonadota bacterium]
MAPVALFLLLPGCFYATLQGGYAPPLTAAPAAAALSFHEGVIGSSSVTPGVGPFDFELNWFGEKPLVWAWGAFARIRAGLEQAQAALGPEFVLGLNPDRYAVVPYARIGVHLLQLDRYQGAWGGGAGSPLVEVGVASCRFWHEVPCLGLAAVAERDLRLGPAPDSTQLTFLVGAGVGF